MGTEYAGESLIRDELVRIQTGIEAEYNAARANATRLEHQIDQLKGQSNVTTEKQPPPSARSRQQGGADWTG